MSFEELFESLPDGWLSLEEARLLLTVAQASEGPILEVGSHWGRSTVLLASLGRPVYSVDPFTNFDSDDPQGLIAFKNFHDNIKERGITNVQQFQVRIENWKLLPVGFAYLDGDHTYVGTTNQLATALDAGAKEFCIHDYAPTGGGRHIKEAIRDCPFIELVEVVERMAHCRKL